MKRRTALGPGFVARELPLGVAAEFVFVYDHGPVDAPEPNRATRRRDRARARRERVE